MHNKPINSSYVHGYSQREAERLADQSGILKELLHRDTRYSAGSQVLEAGCGIGAQTCILAGNSPGAQFTSIDISEGSLKQARQRIRAEKIPNVIFKKENILSLSFPDRQFDHIFVCFVLEHLSKPLEALTGLKRVLKPGGTITVIEGDHGSCFWHPETAESLQVWLALIIAQQQLGHDPLIGRRLYPLLCHSGYRVKEVGPRYVYADASNPSLLDGMVNKIIVPMVESSKNEIFKYKIVDDNIWQKGIHDLTASGNPPNGTFFYTWFKALAIIK
jgi:2-polyprenyl-3-methyl-5-hydroxy-6-metoxy-1,4-benzoquinol methylase